MTPRKTAKNWIVNFGLLLASVSSSWAVTLGQGVDNTNLVWTTGGNAPWFATNRPVIITFDHTNAAASGNIAADEESWIQTTVTGPGTLSFWWYVSSEDFDLLEFQIDGEFQDAISGEFVPFWEYQSYVITNGSHTLKWRYFKDSDFNGGEDQGYLDQVRFTSGPGVSLAESLNTPYKGWTTDGNSNPTYWTGQTNVYRNDGKAGESGAITHLQESWMETKVIGVTNVSFWWKVSSETNFDFLTFYIDGVANSAISGEVDWQLRTNISLTAGMHTLRWTFSKDDGDFFAVGQNRGWLDQVTLLPSASPGSMTLTAPVQQSDGQVQFNLNYALGYSCEIQYTTNLAASDWTTLIRTNTASATTAIVDSGATNSSVYRFYRAKAP